MAITTSTAFTTSSVQGLGNSCPMSMPTSAIASTTTGLSCSPGSEPPVKTSTLSPARLRSQPAAIWDRPALCTQRKSTPGLVGEVASTLIIACIRSRANRSANTLKKVGFRELAASRSKESTRKCSILSSSNVPWNCLFNEAKAGLRDRWSSRGNSLMRRLSGMVIVLSIVRGKEFVEQGYDALLDVVTNGTDLFERFSRRVNELPIEIPLARVHGTRVAAAHGDNDVSVESHLVGQLLWRFVRDIDALFPHHFDDRRIQSFARCRARRMDDDLTPSQLTGEGRGHLRPPGVVHAQEKDLWSFRHGAPSTLARGSK